MYAHPLACLDLETTGTNPVHDRIIEIGVVLVEPDGSRQEWSSLVDPETGIPPFIESLTGISNAAVKDAPNFSALAYELQAMLDDRILVAHNARFDYGFLRNAFQRIGIRFHRQPLCTVQLSRTLFPDQARHNLDAVIRHHGLAVPADRHRALADARVLDDFIRHCYATLEREQVDAVIDGLLKRTALPKQVSEEDFRRLPEAPGVYRFYDTSGSLLYVGKSINIRNRVLSHFSADHASGKTMKLTEQARRIDFTETAGELGALLLESREIKEYQPILNRRQRRHEQLFALHLLDDPGAMPVVDIVTLDPEVFDMSGMLFGPYRNKRAIETALHELAAEHGFCLKLLGLEKSPKRDTGKPCFARQLHRCRGACVNETESGESAIQHWLRLQEALEKIRFASWPFEGAIGIRESAADGRTELHVLDNWCWLGTIDEAEQADMFRQRRNSRFDLDTYKILTRYLLGRKPKLAASQIVKFGPRENAVSQE